MSEGPTTTPIPDRWRRQRPDQGGAAGRAGPLQWDQGSHPARPPGTRWDSDELDRGGRGAGNLLCGAVGNPPRLSPPSATLCEPEVPTAFQPAAQGPDLLFSTLCHRSQGPPLPGEGVSSPITPQHAFSPFGFTNPRQSVMLRVMLRHSLVICSGVDQ